MTTLSNKLLRNSLTLLCAVALVVGIIGFWAYGQFYVSTDDAYINANVVQIAPRISGQITRLYVINNQYVKQGQPLFEIDSTPFKIAVDEAKAQLAIDQARLDNAQATATRMAALVKKHAVSSQQGDDAQAGLQSAFAATQLSKANLDKAELNLQYTTVIAPTSGWVTNVVLREGNLAEANQPLFALISDQEFWVDANFKETDLNTIHSGQKVDIKIDMYPGHSFIGVVQSISGGSGNVFSLLPPQNATGNWVKVTQRVPVRVLVLNTDSRFPLRIGTSAAVKIHI